MLVEFLFWAGCPSHPAALADLRAAMRERGLDPGAVVIREVATEAGAAGERFAGSPTIRVNGRDVVDPGDEPIGLACRIYRLRDGRISPTPDRADVRAALDRALGAHRSAA